MKFVTGDTVNLLLGMVNPMKLESSSPISRTNLLSKGAGSDGKLVRI